MNLTVHPNGVTAELTLDADSTIENARALHEALFGPEASHGELVVNMSRVQQIDVTCLQLLCAAHHAATRDGRTLRLDEVSAAAGNAMELLGFIRHIGCRDDRSGGCLWLGRGNA